MLAQSIVFEDRQMYVHRYVATIFFFFNSLGITIQLKTTWSVTRQRVLTWHGTFVNLYSGSERVKRVMVNK